MRTLLIAVLLLVPVVIHADPCRAHCRDVARVCKDRCRERSDNPFDSARRHCEKQCTLHEHECRAHC